ncbi:uncharacterized protein [Typha latifolia]|uniref:uncharacterized protein isoform X1 n=1 Tax=Typha latifolia TaxID=4733 RepID=UPI003C2C0EBC
MARLRAPALVWISSAILFYLVFKSAMDTSNSTSNLLQSPNSVEPSLAVSDRRSRLYDEMSRDLNERGAVFLNGGETSQSLALSDIFELRDGVVTPILKAANPPVRANVLHLSSEFARPISEAVGKIFLPYFDGGNVWGHFFHPFCFFCCIVLKLYIRMATEIFCCKPVIWFQNTSLYHFSMFHASHHLTPVRATDNEIEAEVNAVRGVSEAFCPLKIVLDRVVLTSTGVLLGCWQVISGTDPADIRATLRKALPNAPEKQLYDPVLLHTSFARLLGHPKLSLEESKLPFDQLHFFHELVARVNDKIHGFEATISELWFVEEYDVLALALNGRMKARRFHMGCSGGD